MNEVMTIAGRKFIFPFRGERRAIIKRAVIAIETETRALTETDLRMAWIDDAAARDREITALRAALDGLVKAAEGSLVASGGHMDSGWNDVIGATQSWHDCLPNASALRAALAKAKETP